MVKRNWKNLGNRLYLGVGSRDIKSKLEAVV
jgi:hypothetical protein